MMEPRHFPGLFEAVRGLLDPGARQVLDLGTGEFPWTFPGYEIRYTDRKPEPHPNFTRVDLDETPYPFVDGEFDQVVAIEIIEHLERPFDFFRECTRVLRPGGWLVVTTPNVDSPTSRRMFFESGDLAYFEAGARASEDGHRTPIFRFELERWVARFGYVSATYRHFPSVGEDILILKAQRSGAQ